MEKPIQISVSGFVKFMDASAVLRRSILHDQKYPSTKDGKRRAPILRYSEANAAIARFHSSDNSHNVLEDAIDGLKRTIIEEPERDSARLGDNVRALTLYLEHFSTCRYKVLELQKPKYRFGEVTISATPDLTVEEAGKLKYVRFGFSVVEQSREIVGRILKITHAAAEMSGMTIDSKNVLYVDVPRQVKIGGKPLNVRLQAEVEATCEAISAMWPKVVPRS